MHYSLHHSQEPHLYFHDIDRWNIYFGMAQHIAGRAEKKKRERESRTNNTAFLVCFGFVTGWLSVLLLLLQDAVTETHKGTHSGTRHSHIPAVVSQKRKQERVLAHTQTHTATHSRLDVTA